MSAAPRVLIADGQPATRLGMRVALERDGQRVVAEAGSGAEALAAARRTGADVCLVDVVLPGGGVATIGRLAAALPAAIVIALAAHACEDDLLAALRAGAAGYLLKEIGPRELARTVRGALAGEAPLPRTLAARVVEELRARDGARRVPGADGARVTLSPREARVLGLLARGLSTREVARRLAISPVTVRRHAADAAHRLGVADRAAALALLDRRGGRR